MSGPYHEPVVQPKSLLVLKVLEVSVHVLATALQLLTHLGYFAAGYITPGVSSDVQIREP